MKNLFVLLFVCCLVAPSLAQAVSLEQNGVFDKNDALIELRDLTPPVPGSSPKILVGIVSKFKFDDPFSILTLKSGRSLKTIRGDISGLSNADLPPITEELLLKGHKVRVVAWLSKGVLVANSIKKWPSTQKSTPAETYATKRYATKATGKGKAPTPIPLRGEPLRAVVGVLGTADVDYDDEARKIPGVYNARLFSALYIKDLRMSKETNRGLLHIRYYFPGNMERAAPQARCMVRLFDANGSLLTYFNTTDLAEIPLDKNMRTWAGYVNWTFQVNTRDLRDTRIVEFGYIPRG